MYRIWSVVLKVLDSTEDPMLTRLVVCMQGGFEVNSYAFAPGVYHIFKIFKSRNLYDSETVLYYSICNR